MCIANQNYIIQAIDEVLTWDLPEECIPLAVIDQAKFMSGIDCDQAYQDILQ